MSNEEHQDKIKHCPMQVLGGGTLIHLFTIIRAEIHDCPPFPNIFCRRSGRINLYLH